jgi:hypothetical protein
MPGPPARSRDPHKSGSHLEDLLHHELCRDGAWTPAPEQANRRANHRDQVTNMSGSRGLITGNYRRRFTATYLSKSQANPQERVRTIRGNGTLSLIVPAWARGRVSRLPGLGGEANHGRGGPPPEGALAPQLLGGVGVHALQADRGE